MIKLKTNDLIYIQTAEYGAKGVEKSLAIVLDKNATTNSGLKFGLPVQIIQSNTERYVGTKWRIGNEYEVILVNKATNEAEISVKAENNCTKAIVKTNNSINIGASVKSPEDEYDFKIGALIAIMRGFKFNESEISKVVDVLFEDEKTNLHLASDDELLKEIKFRMSEREVK